MNSTTGFFWILAAGAIYGLIHSLLASNKAKDLAAGLFGEGSRKFYRLFFVALAVPTTLIYVGLVFLLPDRLIYIIPYPWVVITLLLELAALVGLLLALSQTGTLDFLGLWPLLRKGLPQPEEKLITSGVYGYMRHPIYTFTILFLFLAPRMSWNLLSFSISATLYMLIGSIFEEKKLRRQFGEDYRQYAAKIPGFIPKIMRR